MRDYFGGKPHHTADVVAAIQARALEAPDDPVVLAGVRSVVYNAQDFVPVKTERLLRLLVDAPRDSCASLPKRGYDS